MLDTLLDSSTDWAPAEDESPPFIEKGDKRG
jgi:hypothetical protein